MGKYLLDQYSYLHFAVGIIFYFWNVSLKNLLVIHVIFEIFENSGLGILMINKIFPIWPGGKPKADSLINEVGDILASLLGWLSAYYIDQLGAKYSLYKAHLVKS